MTNNKKNLITKELKKLVSIQLIKYEINFKSQNILDKILKPIINWQVTNV